MTLLVTGGAGFIGSALVRRLSAPGGPNIVNADALTYAGNLDSLARYTDPARYVFEHVDIRNAVALESVFRKHQPSAVVHLAAETHVDRSIDAPDLFVTTNVWGTATLLESALAYFRSLSAERARNFRFLHVSTDEVYGEQRSDDSPVTEDARYQPSSPYAATKGAADHLVRAWHRTYGLPVVIGVTSNNYGPFQYPEKFIPHMILSAVTGRELPIYGDGLQVRDWLHVEDHVEALLLVLQDGKPGQTYNIGAQSGHRNLEVAREICRLLERFNPRAPAQRAYEHLISHVGDRMGHDHRYALDTGKIRRELGWHPRIGFEEGLANTVLWYLENREWWERVLKRYRLERAGVSRSS